jgi:hypothetical protein
MKKIKVKKPQTWTQCPKCKQLTVFVSKAGHKAPCGWCVTCGG